MRLGFVLLLISGVVNGQPRRRYNNNNERECNPRYFNCNYGPPPGGYPQGPRERPQSVTATQQQQFTTPLPVQSYQGSAVPQQSYAAAAAAQQQNQQQSYAAAAAQQQSYTAVAQAQQQQAAQSAAASYQAYLASLQNPPTSPPTSSFQQTPAYSPPVTRYPANPSSSLFDVVPVRSAPFIVPSATASPFIPSATSTPVSSLPSYIIPPSSSVQYYVPAGSPVFDRVPSPTVTRVPVDPTPSVRVGPSAPISTIPSIPFIPAVVATSPPTAPPFPPTVPPFSPTAPPSRQPTSPLAQYSPLPTANAVYLQCGTTKGPFRLRVEPEWAPLGAARFLAMVDQGFFNDIAFFRVVPGFLVQFGLAATPDLQAKWADQIRDDPHLFSMPFKRGMLSFAGSGPNSRSSQMFIAFQDSTSLGTQPWETPFAQVEDMQVIDSIYSGYGEMQAFGGRGPDSSKIAQYGNALLRQQFPLLDYIQFCQRIPSSSAPSVPPTEAPTQVAPSLPVRTPAPVMPPPLPTPKPPTSPKPTAKPTSKPTAKPTAPVTKPPTVKAGKGAGKANAPAPTAPVPAPTAPAPAPTQATPPPSAPVAADNSLPRCSNDTCGSAIATDQAGTNVICSCHESCLRDKNCCRDFLTVCPRQSEVSSNGLPSCGAPQCGRALMDGTTPLCSCHSNCVAKKTCCPLFADMCPEELARASASPAATASSPPASAAPTPRCTANDCTFAFMEGDRMLCSCAQGCEEKNNCCPDYQAVCVNAVALPGCTEDACGSEYRAKNSSELLCSCDSSCVPANTCCRDMAQFCPDQLAQARHAAAAALLAGVTAPPTAADRPKCTPESCGADLANDKEGLNVICSCYFQCIEDGTCCDDFQAVCPSDYEMAMSTASSSGSASSSASGKGKGGGKGKGKS